VRVRSTEQREAQRGPPPHSGGAPKKDYMKKDKMIK
jgi:hypothetical protein